MSRIDRAFALLFLLAAGSVASTQGPSTSGYWEKREQTLSSYTYVWELETHEKYLAKKIIPARSLKVGKETVTLAGLNHDYEFTKRTTLTIARKGDECQVVGKIASYNMTDDKGDALQIRSFFGKDWIGSVAQVPKNGDLKGAMFEVFAQIPPATTCEANRSAHEFDGEFAPFLFGVNPFAVYHLTWKSEAQSDGSTVLNAQNYDGLEHVTNLMASNGATDFEYRIGADGKLLSEYKYADRKTNPKKLPPHEVTALKWISVAGYDIPSEVLIHCNKDISGKMYSGFLDLHWRLVRVSPTHEEPTPPIPIGMKVADWRLQQTEYDPWNTPPSGAEAVYYKWDGRLPTMDELRGLAAKQPRQNEDGFAWTSILVYGGPSLLILAGVLLVARGKSSKGAKTR